MHLKYDLKGSTYKRKASKRERSKNSPTYKDLDFMEMLPEGLLLEPDTYTALVSTMRRDCRVLESFKIMDYSLLVGVHNLDQAARDRAEGLASPPESRTSGQRQKLVAHSTAMESIQATSDPVDIPVDMPPGGIPARNHKGERLLLFVGIIDILQSYRLRKKLKVADTNGSSTDFKVPAASTSSSSSDSSPDGESAAKKAKKSTATATSFGHQKDSKVKTTTTAGAVAGSSSLSGAAYKTVQDDPTKSEVYKRLFSSHKSAVNQPKGHWVTFDPRYN